jgi:hypothetical protein
VKIRVTILIVCLVVVCSIHAQDEDKTASIDNRFKNWSIIRTSIKGAENIDEATLIWGKNTLAALILDKLDANEKARAIQKYISRNFEFHFSTPQDIPEFLETGRGNCFAHSRLSVFLLRLAGIPAKFAYEVHLELKTESSAKRARERGDGLGGHFHNDHIWILYHNGDRWKPYDSALGYTGFNGFHSRWEGTETIPDNPPFVIWEDTGSGFSDMRNITEYIWNQFPVEKHNDLSPAEWKQFLSNFYDKDLSFFQKPLDESTEKMINRVARKFFNVRIHPFSY